MQDIFYFIFFIIILEKYSSNAIINLNKYKGVFLMKKFISIMMSVLMLISVMSVMAFADEEVTPVIFVDGIGSSDTINTETGETVFPLSLNTSPSPRDS